MNISKKLNNINDLFKYYKHLCIFARKQQQIEGWTEFGYRSGRLKCSKKIRE